MRLLQQLQDDNDFSLVERVGKDIPPYAILSHTWGPDNDEVTFNDVMKKEGKDKRGYRKLTFCNAQAKKDGLEFFWVDTCCIDKSSSAELTEAINSMFQWYQRAQKCYIFLTDVSSNIPARRPVSDVDALCGATSELKLGEETRELEAVHEKLLVAAQQAWTRAFESSRWFRRGWTLQELLAPKEVEFFTDNGEKIGDRVSLLPEIHRITGISIQALKGAAMSQFNTEERMSWAVGRETKREEDAAYSLLGIFDIHMPLIYGEGQKHALGRLRKEIQDSLRDRSLPSSTVPFRRDDDFVTRDSLEQVRTICARPAGRAALVGLGGVGKSQIAIEYTYQIRDESPTIWVFWLHAGTQARFEDGYRRIAETTKMEGWDKPGIDFMRLVRTWLCNPSSGQWAMVVDNADDSNIFFSTLNNAQSEPLSNFLPQSPNGSILFTSRSQEAAFRLVGHHASIIEVKGMDEKDALGLLQKKLTTCADTPDATELVQALDCMPLAITQAAAFINQRIPRMTVSRYLDGLRSGEDDRARLLQNDIGDSRRDGSASNSVISTWQISFEHIRREMPSASRLLSLMSLFDRQGIPDNVLQGWYKRASNIKESRKGSKKWLRKIMGSNRTTREETLSSIRNGPREDKSLRLRNRQHDSIETNREDGFEKDINTLINYSLVRSSADGNNFEMHRLVQFSMRKWLELSAELEHWKEVYAVLLDSIHPTGRYENWDVCRPLFPHVQAAIECQPSKTKAVLAWASVLYKGARYADEMGQSEIALRMNTSAVEVRKRILGAKHQITLRSMADTAMSLTKQGKYTAAKEMSQQALEGFEKILGKKDYDTLAAAERLAMILDDLKEYEASEQILSQTLKRLQKISRDDHRRVLICKENLAKVSSHRNKHDIAEQMFRQIVAKREEVVGKEHPDTLVSLGHLAIVLRDQGSYKASESSFQQAIEGLERTLGKEHPTILYFVSHFARLYQNQNQYDKASPLFKRALGGL